jgi:hypothetical protein
MNVYWLNGIWTTGTFSFTEDIPLNPSKRYLVTGALTQSDGRTHLYISMVCTLRGDVQLCGVRDVGNDDNLWLYEFLPPNASKVQIKLKSSGGRNKGEYLVYEL